MAITLLSKICETILMTWSFLTVGIIYSVVGPVLLDLQLLLNEDLKTMSTIILGVGIGETAGMFFAMWLARYGPKRLQIAIAFLLASILFMVIPVVPNIIYVDFMFAMVGFLSAIPSCFMMDICSELWRDKGTSFQVILIGVSVGETLCPLIAEPFLCHIGSGVNNLTGRNSRKLHGEVPAIAKQLCLAEDLWNIEEICVNSIDNQTFTQPNIANSHNLFNVSSCSCATILEMHNTTWTSTSIYYSHWAIICEENSENNSASSSFAKSMQPKCCHLFHSIYGCRKALEYNGNSHRLVVFSTAGNGTQQCTAADTNVRFVFVVLGSLFLPNSFGFIYYWFQRNSKWANGMITECERQDYVEFHLPSCSKPHKMFFYTLNCLLYLPLTAISILFATYLTAFGVKGGLGLSKSTMVFMTSVFWFSTLVGRILSTVLTRIFGNTTIIIVNFGGLIISAILLTILAPHSAILLWVSTVLLGIFSCSYGGAGLAYASQFVGMSSKLITLSWTALSVGNLAFPFIGGMMFASIGPTSFLYLLSVLIVFMVTMFAMMMITAKKMTPEL